VRLLLDTHALLWSLASPDTLAPPARAQIEDPANLVMVSAATAWEIAIKQALGRLSAPDDLRLQLTSAGFEELVITVDDAVAAGALPPHHSDPFDRMLIAQALLHDLVVVTRDPAFATYGVRVLAP
jgi:PIN domain nuclease of toxin-antitoxin system